ncbi:hypothetical protein [Desertivirga brevis]|nr:hypothetical protein [Pedobacter sp. SYSU D00873]
MKKFVANADSGCNPVVDLMKGVWWKVGDIPAEKSTDSVFNDSPCGS